MKDYHLYDMTSKVEYEANLFTADLLISDQDVDMLSKDDDMDYFKMCKALNVTPYLMSFKLFSLIQRRYHYNMPMGIDMGKLKVYLDTSVISHLLQEDVPKKWLIPDNCGKCFAQDSMRFIFPL